MKKILILSYYFPPSNNIGAQRAKSFATYFPKFQLRPTVITRHWKGGERVWDDYLIGDSRPPAISEAGESKLIQLPYSGRKYRLAKRLGPVGYRGFLFFSGVAGFFQPDADAQAAFRSYTRNCIRNESFDFILVTSPPFNLVKLGCELSREFDIPLIVDLRDLWSNRVLAIDKGEQSFRDKVLHTIQEHYARIWLHQASLISVVSEQMAVEIERLVPNANTVVITNGFEDSMFTAQNHSKNEKFTFSVVGTLYTNQDLSLMLEGLKRFVAGKDLNTIQLNYIGTAVISDVAEKIQRSLPKECTYVSERVSHPEALKFMIASDVLFYPGWKGYRGMASGKIFEYLAARRNILIAPSDADVIERLLRETGAGKSADSVDAFVSILNVWYSEWAEKGVLGYKGDTEEINFYSRQNQAKLLAKFIHQIRNK